MKIFDTHKQQSVKRLIFKKNFRHVIYKEDGSSTYWKDEFLSLKDIISEFSHSEGSTLFFQYDSHPVPIARKSRDDEGSLFGFSQSSIPTQRTKIDFEVTIKEINYELEPAFILIFQDISNVIKNQNSKMQRQYQEALTATISHEQMNPLNSIIFFSEFLKNKFKQLIKATK